MDAGTGFVSVYGGAALSFNVTGLTASTTYNARVSATNQMGMGPYCAAVPMTTKAAPDPISGIGSMLYVREE